MTHTIHRKSCSCNRDYLLILSCTKGVNSENSRPKLIKFMEEIAGLNPVAFGNPKDGSTLQMSPDEVLGELSDGSRLHIVFDKQESVYQAVQKLKDLDLGLSACLTGPKGKVQEMCLDLGLTIDSVHMSLGILGECGVAGNAEKIISMCGHMRVSPHLVEFMIDKIKARKCTPLEAARDIAKVCKCGNFNISLAAELLEADAGSSDK